MGAIEKSLDAVGIHNHVRLDSVKWADQQEKVFIKMGRFTALPTYPSGNKETTVEIYKMIHQKDKALSADYKLPEYLIPVQVGTALGIRGTGICRCIS